MELGQKTKILDKLFVLLPYIVKLRQPIVFYEMYLIKLCKTNIKNGKT